jgi:hypothetical protein
MTVPRFGNLWTPASRPKHPPRREGGTSTDTHSTDHTLPIPIKKVMLLRTAIAGSRKAVGAGLVQNGSGNKAAAMAFQVRRAGRGVLRACMLSTGQEGHGPMRVGGVRKRDA